MSINRALYNFFRLDDKSEHWDFWESAKLQIKEWKFLRSENIAQSAPSLNSLIWDINAMNHLWPLAKSLGFKYLLTRRFNQDPLENFNGLMRNECGNNRVPTVPQFESGFTSLVLNCLDSVDHLDGTNCQPDDLKMEPLKPYIQTEFLKVN
jgi:hypothetical protein